MWKDVTDTFSEEERYYKDTYLEICEVYNEKIECSLFSRDDGPYEIYVSFDLMVGLVYVSSEEAKSKREEIKKALEEQWKKEGKATSKFINEFHDKYHLCLSNDLFFDSDRLFKALLDLDF